MIVVAPCDEAFYHPSVLILYVKKKKKKRLNFTSDYIYLLLSLDRHGLQLDLCMEAYDR